MENLSIKQQFETAKSIAMDPQNSHISESGEAITSLFSPWLHLPCSTCQHTFRLDDKVIISPDDGSVYHHDSVTACTGEQQQEISKNSEASQFLSGLNNAWPPPDNLSEVLLEPGHTLLAPAHDKFQRYTCAVCGHTLRPYDVVILCPCRPNNPMCRIAIHRDPIHGLQCWDDWNPGEYALHCPATSRKLSEK